jgi:hypothetical protein
MNTLVTILNKPNQTFEYLEKKYEDVSNPAYDVIFMVFGAFSGLISFLADYKSATIFFNIHPVISGLLTMLLGAGIAYIFGKHIIAPITYWIGKALRGQAFKEHIRMLIAYSWIPLFFRIPFDIYNKLTSTPITGIEYWIITGAAILTYIWAVKIEIQGLMFFNKYGLIKAIINKLPFFILQGGIIYLTLSIT